MLMLSFVMLRVDFGKSDDKQLVDFIVFHTITSTLVSNMFTCDRESHFLNAGFLSNNTTLLGYGHVVHLIFSNTNY